MPFRRVAPRSSFRKKTIKRKPAYKRRPIRRKTTTYKKRTLRPKRMSRPTADYAGARIASKTTTDPSALAMYRSIGRTNSSGLSHVKVRDSSAIADAYDCKFKWQQSSVGILSTTQSWYGNSIIDCGTTLDNQDCAYVPELGAIYLSYRVNASHTKVYITNTSNDTPVVVVLYKTIVPIAQQAAALPTTLDGWSTTSTPHKIIRIGADNGMDSSTRTLSDYCKSSAIFNGIVDMEDFSGFMPNVAVGQSGSPPTAPFQWFWGVCGFTFNGGSLTPAVVYCNVETTYYTTLYEPITSSEYTPMPDVPDASNLVKSLDFPPVLKPGPGTISSTRKKSLAPEPEDIDDFVPVKKQRFAK